MAQAGSFNTINAHTQSIGGSVQVWARIDKKIHFGRKIDVSSLAAGTVIPAGSMVIWDNTTDTATVVKASDASNLSKVNGLIENEIVVPDGCVFASCAIVTAGKIWADATDVPTSVEAQLPMIEFIRARH